MTTSTSGQSKLSKKQKKGIAFRQRRNGKAGDDIPLTDVPGDDEIDDHDGESGNLIGKALQLQDPEGEDKLLDKTKGQNKEKKRKRKSAAIIEQTHGSDRPPKKRRQTLEVAEDEKGEDADTSTLKTKQSNISEVKTRFILFVGNLKYTTTKESIQNHFSFCDPPPVVRLLTPKTNNTTSKSKGCAFLEFTHRNALQQALKLHQSELDGRKINVELTAGGGGKSNQRLNKVMQKNKELAAERKMRIQKLNTTGAGGGDETEIERPQRHSKTSGLQEPVLMKRTWTVGDTDDGTTHRGGSKNTKGGMRGARKPKNLGTGVNLIPIG